MYPKLAIATTLKNTGEVLRTFLEYHASIGFDHFFLFFDDPNDETISIVNGNNNVTVIKNDGFLKKLWENTQIYKERSGDENFHKDYCNELIGKQVLNLSVAIHLALEFKIDWILHIDVDEIFYSPFLSAKEHFSVLESHQITKMSYVNHEAVPEDFIVRDYFKEVTLFKKNLVTLTENQKATLHFSNIFRNSSYFNYYGNGKSAAKITSNLIPNGPHFFDGQSFSHVLSMPSILHYPICGFNYFREKYQILGDFSDYWFGLHSIKESLPFHIKARNAFIHQKSGDIEQLYINNVMLSNEQINYLLSNDILFRVNNIMEKI